MPTEAIITMKPSRHHIALILLSLLVACAAAARDASDGSGVVMVAAAGTEVTTGGIVILQHPVIADPDGAGVIRVTGNDLVLDFRGAMLRGSDHVTLPDAYQGVGIHVTGRNVTLQNVALSGFRIAILAENADGLRIEHADISDNYRQRLCSSFHYECDEDILDLIPSGDAPLAQRYGAAIAVRHTRDISIEGVRVREGQNGIVLEHVGTARLVGNDCSFLSGWGIVLHQCDTALISRNRLDFCVRGFSHGFYEYGHGAAGVLLIDAGADIRITENSMTHCGVGVLDLRSAAAAAPPPLTIDGNDVRHAARDGLHLHVPFGEADLVTGPKMDDRVAPAAHARGAHHDVRDNRGAEGHPALPAAQAAALRQRHETAQRVPAGTLPARDDVGGREAIRLTGWGPWDHVSIRLAEQSGLLNFDAFRVLGARPSERPAADHVTVIEGAVSVSRGMTPEQIRVSVTREQANVLTFYRLGVEDGPIYTEEWAAILAEQWTGMLFASAHDPIDEYDAWRSDALLHGVALASRRIDFPIYRDPLVEHQRRFAAAITGAPITVDNFGLVFTTRMRIRPGHWRVTVIGEDGFRLRMNEEIVIDEWQPRSRVHRASHEFRVDQTEQLELDLEYFQHDGPALLRLQWEALDDDARNPWLE